MKVAPAETVTLPEMATALGVVSNMSVPLVPCPTVRLLRLPVAGTVVLIVTVIPSFIVTSSPDAGTPPPQLVHVPVVLQLPVVVAVHEFAGGLNVRALLLAKIVEDQRSEIRGRRSVLFA